jgi:hypothetical protein
MDIFRKNKKKQQQAIVAPLEIASTSFTDQLDQIAITAAEMENDASFIGYDDEENVVVKKEKSTKSGIDALIDSDEDGAEIFNDCDESSDEDEDNVHDTPSSRRSTMSRQSVSKFQDVVTALDDDVEQSRARLSNGSSEVVELEDDGDGDEESSSTRDEDDDDEEEKSNSDSAEDYTDDEDEGEDGYKPGGYHPVKIGEVYNQRFVRFWM